MNDILKGIGSFVLSLILIAVPILCGISFFVWPSFVAGLLAIISTCELIILGVCLYSLD